MMSREDHPLVSCSGKSYSCFFNDNDDVEDDEDDEKIIFIL